MAMETITSAGNQQTTQARTVYDFPLLDALDDFLVVLGFAEVHDIPPGKGQSGSLRRLERLAVKSNPLTEGTTPSNSNATLAEVTWTNAQYGDYVPYSDWFDLTAPDPIVVGLVREQGRQAALSLDTAAQAVYLAGTKVTYVNGRSARNQIGAGEYVNADLLNDVIKTMRARGVPYITQWVAPTSQGNGSQVVTVAVDPCYIVIVTPAIVRRLKEVAGYVSKANYAAGAQTLPFEVGKFEQLRFVETTNGFRSATGGAGSIAVGIALAFGAGALGRSYITGAEVQAVLAPPTANSGDPLAQKGSVGWKATGAWFIKNQDKMQRFEMAE